MNSLQWKLVILAVYVTRSWFSQAIFVWFELSQHTFFKRKGGEERAILWFLYVCLCDLDGFIDSCDMLKMELR